MAIRCNNSKFNRKKAASSSHCFRGTADYSDLPSCLFDNPISNSKADILEPEPSGKKNNEKEKGQDELRKSEEERKKRKTVKIGTESGVGFSHRKMTKKEKKCLKVKRRWRNWRREGSTNRSKMVKDQIEKLLIYSCEV
jgi:hypothetical protein